MGLDYEGVKCLGEVFDFIKQAAETQGGIWAGRRPGKLCRRQVTLVAKCRMARESTELEAGMSSGMPWQGLELGLGVPVTGVRWTGTYEGDRTWKGRKKDVTEDWSPGECFLEARTTSLCLSSALCSAYNTVSPPRLGGISNRKPGKKLVWKGRY